jgi:site-specific DNA-methyltransferase (adenine-specific)
MKKRKVKSSVKVKLPINQIICSAFSKVVGDWPNNCVPLLLIDPPYGLDKRLSQGAGRHKYHKFRTLYEKEQWDKKIDLEELFRVSENQIIFGANYYSLSPSRGIICWDKKQHLPTFSRWEYIWTSFDVPAKMYRVRAVVDKVHPTEKPLELMSKIIQDFSKPDDIILDACCGSGTTCVAAKMLGRQYIGIDKEEKYCEIAIKRLASMRPSLFEKHKKKLNRKTKNSFRLL